MIYLYLYLVGSFISIIFTIRVLYQDYVIETNHIINVALKDNNNEKQILSKIKDHFWDSVGVFFFGPILVAILWPLFLTYKIANKIMLNSYQKRIDKLCITKDIIE